MNNARRRYKIEMGTEGKILPPLVIANKVAAILFDLVDTDVLAAEAKCYNVKSNTTLGRGNLNLFEEILFKNRIEYVIGDFLRRRCRFFGIHL